MELSAPFEPTKKFLCVYMRCCVILHRLILAIDTVWTSVQGWRSWGRKLGLLTARVIVAEVPLAVKTMYGGGDGQE